jgi:hypothetical protein
MNRKATLAIVSAIVSIASFATTAAAAGPAIETHAYFEVERTRSDGRVEPIKIERTQAVNPAVVAKPTAIEAWFESQRSRTDGFALDAGGPSRYAVNPIAGAFRGRAK